MEDKEKDTATTSFSKKKKRISSIFNTFFIREKIILLANISNNKVKKLVLVLAISILMTTARKKALGNTEIGKNGENGKNRDKDANPETNFAQVFYPQYSIIFWLFDSIFPIFPKELGFSIKSTDVRAQKIDGTMLNIYKTAIVAFLITNKVNQVRLFEEAFLMPNISLKIVFGKLSLFQIVQTSIS